MKSDNVIQNKSFAFAIKIVNTYKLLQSNREYVLSKQLLKSGTSIGANVVEGKSGSSKKDLINFFKIALKSANETKYWMCMLRDGFDLEKKEINPLIQEADEISKILAASLLTLQGKPRKPKSK